MIVRHLAVVAAASSLVACGSSFRATRPVTAPFVKESLSITGGYPIVGSSPRSRGLVVDYISDEPFEIAIAIDNDSSSTLVVTRVSALEPARTLVRQVGTVLTLWDPPTCHTPNCPFLGFPIAPVATAPSGRPVEIGPGKRVGVGLDFRLEPCSTVLSAKRAAPSRIEVTFHVPGGRPQRQILQLGGSRLLLRFPGGGCRVRG